MSDRLALETGANIRGCILNVNINADGNKKFLNEEERTAQLQETQKNVDYWCSE